MTALLEHHLDHEAQATNQRLERLDRAGRDRLAAELARLDAPLTATPRA